MQNNKNKKTIKYNINAAYASLVWLTSKNGRLITVLWIVSMLHSLAINEVMQIIIKKLNIYYAIKWIGDYFRIIIHPPPILIHIYKNILELIIPLFNYEYILIDIISLLLLVFVGTKQDYLEEIYNRNIKSIIYKIKNYFKELLLILVGDFLYKQILAAISTIGIASLNGIIGTLNALLVVEILNPFSGNVPPFLGVEGILARILWLIVLVLINLIIGKFIQHWSYIYEAPSARLNIIFFMIIISIYMLVDENTRVRFLFLVILVNFIWIIYKSGGIKMTKEAKKNIGIVLVKETIAPDDVLHINKDGDVLGELNINIQIIIKENKRSRLDLVFLLDKSASMYNADRQKCRKRAILNFISNLDENARISIVYFDRDIDVRTKLTKDLNLARKEIENMPEDCGGTDYDRAFLKAIEILDDNQEILLLNETEILNQDQTEGRSSISKKIIFISDGNPDNNYNYNINTINKCSEKGIEIYPIGICTHPDSTNIFKNIAEITGGLSLFAESDQDLLEIFEDISKMIPYELIGTKSKVLKIMPPYFNEIKDLKEETPYKQIDKNKYGILNAHLNAEEDGTKTIAWEIGTLYSYNCKWILSYQTKMAAKLPTSLILSDSLSKKSVFKYMDQKGNTIEGTLPLTEIQFKAEPGWMKRLIGY